jgi:predicted transcriptional regulator
MYYEKKMSIREFEQLFKAVGSKRRIAIIKYVKRNPGASVFEVAEEIGLAFRTTSKHLGILSTVGILEREQSGFRAAYVIIRELTPEAKAVVALITA